MKTIASSVIQGFAEMGITLHPSSRLVQQANAYLDPAGVLPRIIPPDHPCFQIALEGQRDLTQIAFSLDHIAATIPREKLRSLLQRVVDDKVLPQDSPEVSRGRDAQCELFVAALCMRAGLGPVLNESPDIRCTLAREELGIAVKRIKAGGRREGGVDDAAKARRRFENRFAASIRDAATQIEGSGLPGVIVMDISQSLNGTNRRVGRSISDYDFYHFCAGKLLRLQRKFQSRLQEWTRGKGVCGMVLLDHHVREHAARGWGFELISSPLNLSLFNQRRCRLFQSFSARLDQAICDPGS